MMSLPKAIEIVTEIAKMPQPWLIQDESDALKLLIVAARRLNLVRSYGNKIAQAPLPGEETL